MIKLSLLATVLLPLLVTGCATAYVPPGGRADLSAMAGEANNTNAPQIKLPGTLAAVHAQADGYQSYSTQQHGGMYGGGSYSVVLSKEVEDPVDLQRLEVLPAVTGLLLGNDLPMPTRLQTLGDLRQAAAKKRASLLLVYTFDTVFRTGDTGEVLKMGISLGWAKTQTIKVTSTVTAVVVDVNSGALLASFDAQAEKSASSDMWARVERADEARLQTERAAFTELVSHVATGWSTVTARADSK